MSRGMLKIIVAVLPRWRRSPFTCSDILKQAESETSSRVANNGPAGLKVSQLLPFVHCPPRSNWNSRSERSSETQKPAILCVASSRELRYRGSRAITTPSSTSQSVAASWNLDLIIWANYCVWCFHKDDRLRWNWHSRFLSVIRAVHADATTLPGAPDRTS